jgi:hypothetical protein
MYTLSRPRVESLEDRQCLSTMLEVTNQGHNLKITGNTEWNFVQITQDDVNNTLKIVYGQLPNSSTDSPLVVNTQVYQSSQINRISVALGLGNDNFEYTLAPGTDLLFAKDLVIDTGDGDDCVTINTANLDLACSTANIAMPEINAANGVSTADGQWLTLAALQGSGSSTLMPVIRSSFNVTLNTGTGNDQACVSLGDVASGAKVNVSVDTGTGDDQFWMCNYGRVEAGAVTNIGVNGGSGNDTLCLGTYGDVLGTLNLSAKGNTGNDTIVADAQGLQNGKTTLAIDTGAGSDAVTILQALSSLSSGSFSVAPVR